MDLGYLIARVCRVYSQTYAQTMAMPMRAFWQLSGFVERLLTAEHIDRLQLLITAQRADGDGVKEAFERMGQVAPSPVKFSTRAVIAANSVRDEEGFNALRGMS